jgi:hypothetical protein
MAVSDDWFDVTGHTVWSAKDIWADEERDLTPWVADHLHELGEKLGVNLKFVQFELPVGTFRADILASDESGPALRPSCLVWTGVQRRYGRMACDKPSGTPFLVRDQA